MKKYIVCCVLFIAPALAMDVDKDGFIKICALGDKQERVGALLPEKLARSCELIKNGLELEGSRTFFVKPAFAQVALWKKLKPCMESLDDSLRLDPRKTIKELLKTPQDLAYVLRAANYFGHRKLFEHCVAQWADRDYVIEKFCKFPQEIEGAIAREILVQHKLTNVFINVAVEKRIVVFKGFNCINRESVCACALGNGNFVAAGRSDGTINYWKKIKKRWKLHVIDKAHGEHGIGRLQFIDGDKRLISSGDDSGVSVWDVATKAKIFGFGDEECNGSFFTYNEGQRLLAIGTKEHRINVYSLSDGGEQGVKVQCEGHADEIRCLAFSPSAQMLASAGDDRILALWDLVAERPMHAFELPGLPCSVQYSDSGKCIAVGLEGGAVLIYDVNTLSLIAHKDDAHKDDIRACCFFENDSLLFTGARVRKIKFWYVPSLVCHKVLEGIDIGPVGFMDQNCKRKQLLTGFNNGTLGLANLAPLLKEIKDQRNYFKYGLRVPRARFLVRAFQATKDQPLECTGENGKIFNSLSKQSKAQLIKSFHLKVAEEAVPIREARSSRKRGPRKRK